MKSIKSFSFVSCLALAFLTDTALGEEKNFATLDLDKNNAISYDEFFYVISNMPSIKQAFAATPDWTEAVQILFNAFDKDENKELSPAEYEYFLKLLEEYDNPK